MTGDSVRAHVTAALVLVVTAGALLSGCSRTELTPAPEVVPANPQLFANGPGVAVTSGSPSADQTAEGPVWWFTARDGVLSVYNGSDQSAMVRVSADVLVPCATPARLELSLPDGRRRVVAAETGRPGRVRFSVPLPGRGATDVGVRIQATACRPDKDARTLFAGLRSLRARAAPSEGGSAPQSST